jgi:hypothetical protein
LAAEISFSHSGGGFSIVSLVGLVAALLAVDDTGTGTGGRWTDDDNEYWFGIGVCGFVAAGGWAVALGSLSSSISCLDLAGGIFGIRILLLQTGSLTTIFLMRCTVFRFPNRSIRLL